MPIAPRYVTNGIQNGMFSLYSVNIQCGVFAILPLVGILTFWNPLPPPNVNANEWQNKPRPKGFAMAPLDNAPGEAGMKVRCMTIDNWPEDAWKLLSVVHRPPQGSLGGQAALTVLQQVWAQGETMTGAVNGLGFIFLFNLLQGKEKCTIMRRDRGGMGGGWGGGGWGGGGWGGGGWGGGGGGRSRKTDSHRFATLLVQLYTDRTMKGTLASIINVMVRNPKVGRRLPFFRDNRRGRSSPVFNAWRDSDMPTKTADTLRPAGVGGAGRRPKKKGGRMGKGGAGGAGGAGGKEKPDRAPLADLLEEIIPLFRRLKRTRNALRFPPPPPYPTLPEPATHTVVRVDDPAVRTGLAPQLSDYSCAQRTLSPVSEADVINLCTAVGYGSGSGSGSGSGRGGGVMAGLTTEGGTLWKSKRSPNWHR